MIKQIAIIFSLLLVFCYAESKRLYISSIEVSAKKPNGKSWDFTGKKPDVRIEVLQQKNGKWKKTFTSALFKNTTNIDQVINTNIDVDHGSKVKIKVVDVDSFQNDVIGEYEVTVTDEKTHTVNFFSVKSLSYFFSPYKTFLEHQNALKKKASQNAQVESLRKQIAELRAENERLQLQQQSSSSSDDKWKQQYEAKLRDYNTLLSEKSRWQQQSANWKRQYEDKQREYNALQSQQPQQQNTTKWQTLYQEKSQEYNTLQSEKSRWQQQSANWKRQYEDKERQYNALQSQKSHWQQQSTKWKQQYEDKLREYNTVQNEKSRWKRQYEDLKKSSLANNNTTSNNTTASNNNTTNNSDTNTSRTITAAEKQARTKLDSIFRWAKYANGNPNKLMNYYKQAQPFADVLAKYPAQHKEHLEKYRALQKNAEEAQAAKIAKDINYELRKAKYYLDKNNDWIKYYRDNPQQMQKLSDTDAQGIVQQFNNNIELGNEALQKLEKKFGTHAIIEAYKKQWLTSQKEVQTFTNSLSNSSTINNLQKRLAELQKSLNKQINGYKSPHFSPLSFAHYADELQRLHTQSQKDLGAAHNVSQEISKALFLAKKWTVIAYCDQGILARKNNNKYFMKQSFDNAQKIVGNNKELQQIFTEKTASSSNIGLADAELRKVKEKLLQRIAAESQRLSQDFNSYDSHFEHIRPKRQQILDSLEYEKGKALSNAQFTTLQWSKNGWYLQHDGTFYYTWDASLWKRFRQIELDHYKIFRDVRSKILQKYNIKDTEGRVDWHFPGFHDVKFIAVVEKTATYVAKKNVRDAYGRVIAQVDQDPIQVVNVQIMGIKSKYFTLWCDNDSHRNLQTDDLWNK
ncbi:hypothetical protein [Candidatus Uabimicrobium amorphum]|uniref:Uncharacterized protein n=1 Tax=Uabimicrobium amorphum TaxID=2596890 RepID=A0A5S9IQB2_UABAM|nr:hypothetical protein [Candidatus Uabimicrobium amorphum]BBM85934.1 hypothetical protein UABAM_04320 [Candidatus Uabimicrobium amorphum]